MLEKIICGVLYVAAGEVMGQQQDHQSVCRRKHKRFDRTLLEAAQDARVTIYMMLDPEPYSPFGRHDYQPISAEDAAYLRGTPVPLRITIPVSIEKAS